MKPNRFERYAFGPDRTKDKSERDPIGTVGRAKATLYRARSADKVPDWFDGTLEQYREEVESAVFSEHGEVEVPDEPKAASLSADVILFSGDSFERVSGHRFKKDVLRAGEFTHRSTGEKIAMPPERVRNAVTNTNRFLADGHKVPFPMRHTTEPDRNLGFWREFTFTPDGEALGLVDVERKSDLDKIGSTITDVSVQIEGPVYLSDGTALDEVFTHVCATNYPVVNKQRNFEPVALSLDAHGYSVYVQDDPPEETPSVNLDALKKMLKLSADATEADVEKAIAKMDADKAAAEKKATESKAALETANAESTSLANRLAKIEAKALDDELNLALEAGRISKEQAPIARHLLSSRVKLSLSVDGKDETRDVAEMVREFISLAPPIQKLNSATKLSADEDKARKGEVMAERRANAAAWEATHQGQKVEWFSTENIEGAGMQDYRLPKQKSAREQLGIA